MKPSPTEFVILKHLWRRQPQSQGEIHKAVLPELNWSRSSTRKTIDRMFEKDMLRIEEAHGTRIYFAKLKKIPTIAEMIQSFTATVLGLNAPLPVSNLTKSEILDASELKELDEYLKGCREDLNSNETEMGSD